MQNLTTSFDWSTLDLHTLKKTGADEYHGPCPVTGEGKDCFWVKPDARLVGCRGCAVNGLSGPQFTEHLSAVGGASGESVSLQTYDWTDHSTGETVTQTRTGLVDPKYKWPYLTKTDNLIYPARYDRDATRPIVWTEGAKAASFAASKLPADDYDVIGFVSASKIPSADTLTALSRGRSCVVWPDDDLSGAKVATRLVSALARSASDVRTVVPARLGLTGGHGHDAEQWRPGDDPAAELEAACGAPREVEKAHRFKLVWDIVTQPDPIAVVPGLLYEGHQTVIEAGPKWGKTTLLVDAVAAAYAEGVWLGELCSTPGPILWVSEMAEPLIRAWLARRLPDDVRPNVYISPVCSLTELAAAVEELHPAAVIVDSFIAAFRAERPNAGKPDEWRAGDVREFLTRLRDICPTSLITNHVRKSDGLGRDSGDLHAAVDLLIELRDESGRRRYEAPDPGDRKRTLHYTGRILHGRTTAIIMDDEFAFTVDGGGAKGGSGGGGNPFTVGEPPTLSLMHAEMDEQIAGYLMAHDGVSQNAVRAAVHGRTRSVIERLKVVGQYGPDKLWRARRGGGVPDSENMGLGTGGTTEVVPPVPVNGNRGGTTSGTGTQPIGVPVPGTSTGYHLEGGEREPVLPALAQAKTPPPPPPQGGVLRSLDTSGAEPATDNQAKGDAVVKHEKSCPKCFGKGLDAFGKPCNYVRPVESVTHTSGCKKWDDATKAWVDTLPGGDVFTVEGGVVHLSDGTSVTDGDPRVHWGESWNDIELEQEGMVH